MHAQAGQPSRQAGRLHTIRRQRPFLPPRTRRALKVVGDTDAVDRLGGMAGVPAEDQGAQAALERMFQSALHVRVRVPTGEARCDPAWARRTHRRHGRRRACPWRCSSTGWARAGAGATEVAHPPPSTSRCSGASARRPAAGGWPASRRRPTRPTRPCRLGGEAMRPIVRAGRGSAYHVRPEPMD